MNERFTVSFHGVDASQALRNLILRRAERALRRLPEATGGSAVVERDQQRHQHGNRYVVRLVLTVPGHRFDVCRPGDRASATHEDPLLAIRDSFDALRRQVDAYLKARRAARRAQRAAPEPPSATNA